MNNKTVLNPCSAIFSPLMWLLLVAASLTVWQTADAGNISNPGAYDRTVMSPWQYVDVHWENWKKDEHQYETWPHNDKDCDISETNYVKTSGKKAFGYTVFRADNYDKYTASFKAYYQYSQQVPPYAVFEAEWDWYFCHEGDKGKSLAYFSIFDDKDYAESRNLYIYPGTNASDGDIQNHEYVIHSFWYDRGDNYSSYSWDKEGTYKMSLDNRNGATVATLSRYLMHVSCFYAKSDDGHSKSTIGTSAYRYILSTLQRRRYREQPSSDSIRSGLEGLCRHCQFWYCRYRKPVCRSYKRYRLYILY